MKDNIIKKALEAIMSGENKAMRDKMKKKGAQIIEIEVHNMKDPEEMEEIMEQPVDLIKRLKERAKRKK